MTKFTTGMLLSEYCFLYILLHGIYMAAFPSEAIELLTATVTVQLQLVPTGAILTNFPAPE